MPGADPQQLIQVRADAHMTRARRPSCRAEQAVAFGAPAAAGRPPPAPKLLGTPWPGSSLLVSGASALVVLISGFIYFNRAQRSFADVI